MRVEAVERRRNPAAGGLDNGGANAREQVEYAAADQRPHRRHPGPWVAETVQQKPCAVEIARARTIWRARRSAMRQQWQIERLRRIVQRIEVRVVEQFAAGRLR